jgi:hypothetical protein
MSSIVTHAARLTSGYRCLKINRRLFRSQFQFHVSPNKFSTIINNTKFSINQDCIWQFEKSNRNCWNVRTTPNASSLNTGREKARISVWGIVPWIHSVALELRKTIMLLRSHSKHSGQVSSTGEHFPALWTVYSKLWYLGMITRWGFSVVMRNVTKMEREDDTTIWRWAFEWRR